MRKSKYSRIKLFLSEKKRKSKRRDFKDASEHENSNFDVAIVDFGDFFNHLKNEAKPVSKRIGKGTGSIRILAFEKPKQINPALQEITRLANLGNKPFKDAKVRFMYQKALVKICQEMALETWRGGIDKTLALILERGALLTGAIYNYPRNFTAQIKAKRIEFEGGGLGLGLENLRIPANLDYFKKLHIQEDCIATGDSIAGTILSLKRKKILFEQIEINAIVATQMAIEFLQAFLRFLGVKRLTFKVGGLAYLLDEHFYIKRTNEEGYKDSEYYVGDMGEWSKKLPKKFDKKAWWNKNRLDY